MKKYATGLEIKKRIVGALRQGSMSLRRLETKLNVGYNSLKRHCKELEYLKIIEITKHKKNDANGRPYTTVNLTSRGRTL